LWPVAQRLRNNERGVSVSDDTLLHVVCTSLSLPFAYAAWSNSLPFVASCMSKFVPNKVFLDSCTWLAGCESVWVVEYVCMPLCSYIYQGVHLYGCEHMSVCMCVCVCVCV